MYNVLLDIMVWTIDRGRMYWEPAMNNVVSIMRRERINKVGNLWEEMKVIDEPVYQHSRKLKNRVVTPRTIVDYAILISC